MENAPLHNVNMRIFFTVYLTLAFSAKYSLAYVSRLLCYEHDVRLSVCPSVTLVDCEYSATKWEMGS